MRPSRRRRVVRRVRHALARLGKGVLRSAPLGSRQDPAAVRELLGRLADWALEEEVVFVTGVPRSGTTRFYDVLRQAAPFRRRRGDDVETHLMNHLPSLSRYRSIPMLYRYLGRPGDRELELDRALEHLAGLPAAQRHQALVRAFFHAAKQYGGMARIVEKTPLHCRFIDFFKYCLPRSKFFYLYRHPLDVYASMRRRLGKERALGRDPSGWKWMEAAPDEFVHFYADLWSGVRRFRRTFPDDVRLVGYEEFVQKTSDTLRAGLAWIGVEYAEQLLEPCHAPGNPVDELLYRPIRDYGRDWGEFVARAEADRIQSGLGPVMEELGLRKK